MHTLIHAEKTRLTPDSSEVILSQPRFFLSQKSEKFISEPASEAKLRCLFVAIVERL